MPKLLKVTQIARPADIFSASSFPGPGLYTWPLDIHDASATRWTLGSNLSRGTVYAVISGYESVVTFPVEVLDCLAEIPEPAASEHRSYMDGAELQPGARVVPQWAGFVSEGVLIQICQALAQYRPPNPAP